MFYFHRHLFQALRVLIILLSLTPVYSFLRAEALLNRRFISTASSTTIHSSVKPSPVEDVLPFVEEHIQLSDQMLFLGASTDFSIQMAKRGFGTKKTGYMIVVDSDEGLINECQRLAAEDPDVAPHLQSGKLRFQTAELTSMKSICKQSSFDSIVDYGGLDSLLLSGENGLSKCLECIDLLQHAIRLGNVMVCLSKLEKEVFCEPFEQRFGWMQELDGECYRYVDVS